MARARTKLVDLRGRRTNPLERVLKRALSDKLEQLHVLCGELDELRKRADGLELNIKSEKEDLAAIVAALEPSRVGKVA